MKKTILLLSVGIALSSATFAQATLDLKLYNKVHNINQPKNLSKDTKNKQTIDLFIQGDVKTIKSVVEANGGTYKYATGDIASVNMPLEGIENVVSNKSIKRIEALSSNAHPLNDTMLKNNNVIPVHNGQTPLTQGYEGNGVVIGFIDTGIDITHPDFQDSTHHSRIKYLWDQRLANAANTPQPYNYGQQFTNTDIDNNLATASTDVQGAGHGTHTAGIAVSNGLATGNFKGVAPQADIIMVALNQTNPNVADGVKYIYSKAAAMHEPCVISISYGDTYGSHDGLDLQAQTINSYLTDTIGRALVAAAGNDGDPGYPIHLGYSCTPADTNFSLFANVDSSATYPHGFVDMQLYSNTANFTGVDFSVGADKMSPTHSFRGHIPFRNVSNYTLNVVKYDTLKNSNHVKLGLVESQLSLSSGNVSNGVYLLEFYIIPDSVEYDWRLSTTGTGSFDLWCKYYPGYAYPSQIVTPPLPSLATMPDSASYKLPDAKKTLQSGFQCLDNVITVGAYINRCTVLDYNNILENDGATPGVFATYSSAGPTRDGRQKPDICSPGDNVISDVVLSLVPSYISGGLSYEIAHDQKHMTQSGTSCSAPSVAGIAALFLQKNPTATAAEVKQAIICAAASDQFTGSTTNLPNYQWGYGKADAFATLTTCDVLGIKNISQSQSTLSIFPNPSTIYNSVNFDITNFKSSDKTELRIYNALGELVKSITVTNSIIQLNNSLQSGIYFCNLVINGQPVVTKKMVVL